MKENIVKDKSFAFALRVVNLAKYLEGRKEFVLSKQVLRSGTAIGALVREAEHAESKADFIHKNAVSLKEARESNYWLRLILATETLKPNVLVGIQELEQESLELAKIIGKIIVSAKS